MLFWEYSIRGNYSVYEVIKVRLRTKMLFWIGIPVVVIFIAMGLFVYWEASRMLSASIEQEMRAMAQYRAEEIKRMVDGQKGILEGLTQAWSMQTLTSEAFLPVARNFAQRPDIDALFFWLYRRSIC